MTAGRKPKPAALKIAAGNPGRRPINTTISAIPGAPEAPRHLSNLAREEWDRMIVDLAAMGVLGQENRAALAIYCQNWARWVTAEDHINTHGVIVAAPRTGAPMQNPNVVIANNAADRLIRIAAEFGLTPSSRQRVGIASKQTSEVSAWDMLQVIDGGKSG